MAELVPIPLPLLLRRAFLEYSREGKIFDLPGDKFFRGIPGLDLSVAFHGHRAATPLRPAAGPHLADRAKRLARTSLPRGAVILGLLFVINAGMAVLRDKVLAHTFGAGPELDAFFTALFLPQLVLAKIGR